MRWQTIGEGGEWTALSLLHWLESKLQLWGWLLLWWWPSGSWSRGSWLRLSSNLNWSRLWESWHLWWLWTSWLSQSEGSWTWWLCHWDWSGRLAWSNWPWRSNRGEGLEEEAVGSWSWAGWLSWLRWWTSWWPSWTSSSLDELSWGWGWGWSWGCSLWWWWGPSGDAGWIWEVQGLEGSW